MSPGSAIGNLFLTNDQKSLKVLTLKKETHLTIRKKVTFEEISNVFHDIKILCLSCSYFLQAHFSAKATMFSVESSLTYILL